jgi:ParB-like chromosome segregation protein Spo0J
MANLQEIDSEDIYIAGVDAHPTNKDVTDTSGHITFDPRALEKLDPSFVANVRQEGILVPVELLKDAEGNLWCIDGRNRVMAAREIYAKHNENVMVPYTIADMEESDTSGILQHMISRNLHKPVSISQQARMAKRLVDSFGEEKKEEGKTSACDTYGWSASTLRNRMELLELAAQVIKAVDAEEVLPSTALSWKKMEKAEQVAALEKLRKSGKAGKKKQRTGSNSRENKGGTEGSSAPTKGLIKKLLAVPTVDEVLEPQSIKVLKWATGLVAKPQIANFADLIKKATAKADAKKAPPKPGAEDAE